MNKYRALLAEHNIAINALDFQSDVPFLFDQCCRQKNIFVLHPYNIGWAALLFVIQPNGADLSTISADKDGFEKSVVNFFLKEEKNPTQFKRSWIGEVLERYGAETTKSSPPQLAVASWLLGGLCIDVMCKMATGKPIKPFPDYYFLPVE